MLTFKEYWRNGIFDKYSSHMWIINKGLCFYSVLFLFFFGQKSTGCGALRLSTCALRERTLHVCLVSMSCLIHDNHRYMINTAPFCGFLSICFLFNIGTLKQEECGYMTWSIGEKIWWLSPWPGKWKWAPAPDFRSKKRSGAQKKSLALRLFSGQQPAATDTHSSLGTIGKRRLHSEQHLDTGLGGSEQAGKFWKWHHISVMEPL